MAKLLVSQGVDVGSQTGRGRRVDAGNMVINTILMKSVHRSAIVVVPCMNGVGETGTYVLSGVFQGLLDKVYEIWRAKLPERVQRLGTGVNRFVENLLGDPLRIQPLASAQVRLFGRTQDKGLTVTRKGAASRTREQLAQPW